MKQSYCLPIIKRTKREVKEMINGNMKEYRYFEVWLDYIDDLDNAFIIKLIEFLKDKLIILFRKQNLEIVKLDLQKRLKIISLLENSQSFIDLDVFNQKEELDYIKSNNLEIKTIVSYHNYKETSKNEKLMEIIDTMSMYKPTIYKMSTMCNNQKDALRLLQLLLELKDRNLKCIVLGMSKYGNITRIFGTLWGNEMIFAPRVLKEQSADGQLTKAQLEKIFRELQH